MLSIHVIVAVLTTPVSMLKGGIMDQAVTSFIYLPPNPNYSAIEWHSYADGSAECSQAPTGGHSSRPRLHSCSSWHRRRRWPPPFARRKGTWSALLPSEAARRAALPVSHTFSLWFSSLVGSHNTSWGTQYSTSICFDFVLHPCRVVTDATDIHLTSNNLSKIIEFWDQSSTCRGSIFSRPARSCFSVCKLNPHTVSNVVN